MLFLPVHSPRNILFATFCAPVITFSTPPVLSLCAPMNHSPGMGVLWAGGLLPITGGTPPNE